MEQQKKFSRRKIITIVLIVCVLLVLICAFAVYAVYSYFHPKTDNVFDQLYYEVRTVKWGGDSVLVSGTESAYADYDFGLFENIQIPDLHMSLFIREDTLYVLFHYSGYYAEHGEWVDKSSFLYKYKLKEKKLYGEDSLDYLLENFLNDYFAWYSAAGEENPYTPTNLGTYDFEQQETVYYD